MKKQKEIRQFGIYYMHDTRAVDWKRYSSKAGYNDNLKAAIGRACWHIGQDNYYPKAVIVDRLQMKIVCIVHRTASGISIVERN
jgi:hypothetical protein